METMEEELNRKFDEPDVYLIDSGEYFTMEQIMMLQSDAVYAVHSQEREIYDGS
jgi:hypothetical protein